MPGNVAEDNEGLASGRQLVDRQLATRQRLTPNRASDLPGSFAISCLVLLRKIFHFCTTGKSRMHVMTWLFEIRIGCISSDEGAALSTVFARLASFAKASAARDRKPVEASA